VRKMRKVARRKAIVTMVDGLEASLADCVTLITGTNNIPLGGTVDPHDIPPTLAIPRTRLNMVEIDIEALRAAYCPDNLGIQRELLWLGDHCLKLIEVQARALGGLMDALSVRCGVEGGDAKYVDGMSRYFAAMYDEHRRLTALALREDVEAQRALEQTHILTANEGIADFYRRAAEFEEFRTAHIETWPDCFAQEPVEPDHGMYSPKLRNIASVPAVSGV